VRPGRSNKRMQLTKLRAAPVRQAEVPPCAPAGGTDGGTASQLIRRVRLTNEGTWRTSVVATTATTTESQAGRRLTRAEARINGVARANAEGLGWPARAWLRTSRSTLLRTRRSTENLGRLGQATSIQSWLNMASVAELSCQRKLATEERGQRTGGSRTRG
jgi:hypothetical protein